MNYYNENDPHAAAWLRELIRSGHLPNGIVDDRSICDVQPCEIAGFTQCHFFAGIGGWSLALRLAGWPDDQPVWTGSCPCQPFSTAGKMRGEADERHLWSVFRQLVSVRKPATVFGEQVASHLGRQWLAGVFVDLERMGYRPAGADLCAASVGAPHIRQRLFWVADAGGEQRRLSNEQGSALLEAGGSGKASGMADSECDAGESGWIADIRGRCSQKAGVATPSQLGRSGDAGDAWGDFDLIPCLDGKARRIESGTFPLAHGVPGRMGRLRGYGNAIVPQVAAEFIKAFTECCNQ
jgi:DNA (cytosine-5)-methyltransferase 1